MKRGKQENNLPQGKYNCRQAISLCEAKYHLPQGKYNCDSNITAGGNITLRSKISLVSPSPTIVKYRFRFTGRLFLKMQAFLRVLCGAVPYGFTHNTCRKANITAIAISLPKAISLCVAKYHSFRRPLRLLNKLPYKSIILTFRLITTKKRL